MISDYSSMIVHIDALMDFLMSLDIDASVKSHIENDYLIATDYVQNHKENNHHLLTDEGRATLGGLHELYKWIWMIKDESSFNILLPHLKMLTESAVRINSQTPMINPVTGKQDDSTNKLIETIVAMFAIKAGTDVDLDDPIKSSGGENPDIMFQYSGKKVAIACKTLRGSSSGTFLDNFRSAAKQIKRAKCDYGYIAINAMNILPHDKIESNIYPDLSIPFSLISKNIVSMLEGLKTEAKNEIEDIFCDPKVRPVILTFVHSHTRLSSPVGNISTMIKGTFATELKKDSETERDMKFLSKVNEFIHNRL